MPLKLLVPAAFAITLVLLGTPLTVHGQDVDTPRSRLADGRSPSPGDVVRLRIWREPDWSGDFTLDQDGYVTFPRLGRMHVAAMTEEALRRHLLAGFEQYLRNPSIEVVLLRRVNVSGAVRAPGLYPVDPTMSIAEAIALAGGATPQGDRSKVELIRDGKRLAISADAELQIGDLSLRSGDHLHVPERSWLARNPGLIAASLSAGVSLIIAVFLR